MTEPLFERASRGDDAALHELLLAQLPAVEAYVRAKVGPAIREKESLADVVQSSCLQALRDLAAFEFRGEAELRAWLFEVALSKIRNKARHYRAGRRDAARERAPASDGASGTRAERLSSLFAGGPTPSRQAIAREAIARYEAALDRLPADYRIAVELVRIDGVPYAEAAERLRRSEGAVRNLVYRGLAKLARELDGDGHGGGGGSGPATGG